MSFSSSLRVFTALLILRAIDALRGVHPSNDTKFSSGLVCVPRDAPENGPVTLPASRVNDDYCDCIDGADEPGTAACPGAIFWCRNAAFRPVKLPSSWVDDGSCDCCDGSDEPPGACSDTCSEEKEKVLSIARKQADAIRAGVALRKKYADEAAQASESDKRDIEKLEKELKLLEVQVKKSETRADALRKHRDYEDEMRRAAEKHSPPATSGTESEDEHDDVDLLDDSEDRYNDDHNDEHKHADDTNQDGDEGPKSDEELDDEVKQNADTEGKEIKADGDPDSGSTGDDDEGDMEDDKDLDDEDDYIDDDEEDYRDDDEESDSDGESTGSCSECEKDDSDDDEEEKESETKPQEIDIDSVCAELGARGPSSIARKFNYLKTIVLSKLQRILPVSPPSLNSRERVSDCLRKAENVKYEIESEKRDAEDKLKKLKAKGSIFYGSDGALRKLHGKCIKKAVTQYEFEICPFDLVRQYEHGSAIAVLGKFKGWKEDGGSRVMNYAQGDRCWNGPPRSIKVELSCGETEEIVSVEEPNRCAYVMKFKTPAVCESAAADSLLADFEQNEDTPKDEL